MLKRGRATAYINIPREGLQRMLDDEAALLDDFTFGLEFELSDVRDAGGQVLLQAPDWDPCTDAALAAPSALLVAVRNYSDVPSICRVWDSGERTKRLPHVLHRLVGRGIGAS